MKLLGIFIALLILFPGIIFSQSITLDSVSELYGADTIEVNQEITFYLRITGDENNYSGIANGFRIYSPDGAEWGSLTPDTISFGWPDMFDLIYAMNIFSITGSGADTVSYSGVKLSGSGLPAFFDEVAYTMTIGPIDPSYHKKTIVLDSSYFPPTGVWKWAGPNALPAWGGPYSFTIFDPNAPPDPSNLVLSTDSLEFTAIQDGSPPPTQTFDVLSDLEPLNISLNENADWLIINPIQGITPLTINVSINTIGLLEGTYLDSIEVISPAAANSPLWVKIALIIEPPPPVIEVTPDSIFFNAIAGGENPVPKTITITNIGGSILNWTVSNSENWLSLNPLSGLDSGNVTLTVDITGLPFGEYIDTVVIDDPEASNNPLKVPVFLSVGSDLPLIEVDSAFNFIIVPSEVSSIPPRDILIRNDGAGIMTFWLEENSTRIFTLNPSSGTAPQVVEVGFKTIGGIPGDDYFDTLWVYSDEAINSPYPVVFQFHYIDEPALIFLNRDTLQLNVFECDMGANVSLPEDYFTVSNLGGDNPMYFNLIYTSDYFTVNYDSGVAPQFITVTAQELSIPVGTYYDTILISAVNAINSPETLIVNYNIITGIVAPEIYLSKDSYIIPTKENEGPMPPAAFEILNRFGGCMEWQIQETVPWLFPDPDSGNVPGGVTFNANASGFLFGEYPDSLFVVAPSATNNPRKVSLLLRVWKFHGDVNYTNQIDIFDIVYFVEYMFNDGPDPEPEHRVGDLNCDLIVDIADLVYMVDYSFDGGPIPCGNPY